MVSSTADAPAAGDIPGAPGEEILAVRGMHGAAQRAIASAAAFAALGLVARHAPEGRLAHLDRAAMRALGTHRRPAGMIAVARWVSALAEPRFVSALLAADVLLAARRIGWRAACAPCVTVATGAGARHLLSTAIARPRPPAAGWLTEPEGFSLPSKHTTMAVLTAGACLRNADTKNSSSQLALLLAAAGIGASRVYLGVHWPADILAAWLFGEGWLSLAEIPQTRAAAPSRQGATRPRGTRRRSSWGCPTVLPSAARQSCSGGRLSC